MRNPFPLRTWLILGFIGLLVVALMGWRAGCQRVERLKDEATISDARTKSGQDAGRVTEDNVAARDAVKAEVKDAQDEIARIEDPAVRDARARERLCRLQPSACRAAD